MIIRNITQPESLLGNEIDELLNLDAVYSQIIFVSAFVSLRTILRLRDRLLRHMETGTRLRLIIGIDLGGTSREVLEELLSWNCEIFIFHNPIARATFHPKVYLFDGETSATIFVGSNNLTEGGFYTNYEAATRYDFNLPGDAADYQNLIRSLAPFLDPHGPTVQLLDSNLIQTLVARGELPSEAEAKKRRHDRARRPTPGGEAIPASPFNAVPTPRPPLLSPQLRDQEPTEPMLPEPEREQVWPAAGPLPAGVLVWKKILTRTDALQVREGSHHVGGVRLTQARFENPTGQLIDQTTYFRQLFVDYIWEQEPGGHVDQEHTFVPMRIIIRGVDYDIHNFEISHKPSGEAEQGNYTTILRWGHEFIPTILQENLTDTVFSLHETGEENAPFLINITNT